MSVVVMPICTKEEVSSRLPKIGFGTGKIKPNQTQNAVKNALLNGYRLIDTAISYKNQRAIALAIEEVNIDSSEVVIITKVQAKITTREETIRQVEYSLARLQKTCLDVVLIHAPWPWDNIGQQCREKNTIVWKTLIELKMRGKIKTIGVSNFNIDDLEWLYSQTGVMPEINEIRYFIGNSQPQLVEYCKKNNIVIVGYSPFGNGGLVNKDEIVNIAQKYNCTPAQVCISFAIQNGIIPIPMSLNNAHQKENIDKVVIFTDDDLDELNNLVYEDYYQPYRS